MADVVRTPEEALEGLPDFPFAVRNIARSTGLRLAHLDEGEGAPVVFLHGEPTWSFLWRKVIPPVRDAGFRCIAPDLVGFGRSDKPTDIDFYTYDRHTALAGSLLEDLDVRGATIVVHDWGGPIGLRLAVEHARADRADRDHGHGPVHRPPEDERRLDRVPRLRRAHGGPAGRASWCAARCKNDPGDEVIAAYDAPYPDAASKAGARAFPLLIPQTPDAPGAREGQRVHRRAARGRPRPTLMLWADSDPVLPLADGRALRGGDRARDAAHDRGREPLPAGGSGPADRRT